MAIAAVVVAAPPTTMPVTDLSSLGRQLRHFDFEEAESAPYTMPHNFYRYIAPDQGFPRFGSMRLSNTAAHSGRWSFMFSLDGGSLSARVPTAVIPILPGSDHLVSAWVRTADLSYAAAQVVAQLYDIEHNAIPETRTVSPPLRTDGKWQHVSIEVYGDSDRAADLVIELQILQPQQDADQRKSQPRLGDIAGRVWFDDVTIWRQPRIEISTGAPGNVIVAPDKPVIDVMIRDATTEDLTARIEVLDIDGNEIYGQTHDLPRGSWQHTLKLGDIDAGWYRTVVQVRNSKRIVGARSLDMVVVNPDATTRRDRQLGVVLPTSTTAEGLQLTRTLARHLGAQGAVLPIPHDTAALGPDGGRNALRRTGEQMLGHGEELIIALPGLTDALMRIDVLDRDRVQELLKADEGLTDLLMSFGLVVPRWLLTPGADGSAALGSAVLIPDDQLGTMVDAVAGALSEFVPDPVILVPWSAEYDLAPLAAPHGYWINIPSFIAPEVLPEYAARWPIGTQDVYTTFERLDAGSYTPDQRVVDLMLRTLWGWRAGLPRMAITNPWSNGGPRGTVVPDPAFGVWRAMADRLDGRRFAGELPVAAGVRCWVLTGDDPDDTALVAWNEQAQPDDATLSMLLASGPVDVVDAFGNRRPTLPDNGVHHIPLATRPVFVEGVDPRLVRFRASFRISPDYLTSRHQVHEGDVLLGNPWSDTISGTIRLRPPAGWRITPRIHTFSIEPGGEAKLPISLIFTNRLLTGSAFAEAQVELIADREYNISLRAPLEVGVQDLEFVAYWQRDTLRKDSTDLIITESITNTGNSGVTLTAFVSAPGISRQRRLIGGLQPGQTATRTFRLTDGARLLPGRRVRVGVITQDGARLNRILEIPGERVVSDQSSVISLTDN